MTHIPNCEVIVCRSKMQPLALLLPIARGYVHGGLANLEKVGADPLFDRNVIGIVVQFAVGLSFASFHPV